MKKEVVFIPKSIDSSDTAYEKFKELVVARANKFEKFFTNLTG